MEALMYEIFKIQKKCHDNYISDFFGKDLLNSSNSDFYAVDKSNVKKYFPCQICISINTYLELLKETSTSSERMEIINNIHANLRLLKPDSPLRNFLENEVGVAIRSRRSKK